MKNAKKIVQMISVLVLCIFAVCSVLDTLEKQYQTNFNQDLILEHIEHLTENGPRSIVNKESNLLAVDYIVETLERFGLINEDTTEVPAYMIQDFVAEDTDYQNWYLKNVIVHIPANAEETTGEAIMFMGHLDSVPMGNGASDDGVAVSVMLEAIRYYLEQMANGFTLSNDLVFCFVNGEEHGMLGSEYFMDEFVGFEDVVSRIRFGTNLESRGTNGTLIMFETSANNYNTMKLFSEINENIFTCSIATMIYDMMPNGTDFSNFKEAYQGLNFANILGGENYHTQNDNIENVGDTYVSQQAQIVDKIIEKLADYDLDLLYDAEESAIFFSYLNITTVMYNHATTIVMAILLIVMFVATIILNKKKHLLKRTAKAIVAIIVGLVLTAGVTHACYYLFQYIAVLFGTINIHMVGTITYSNTAIVIGIGLVALSVTALVSCLATKWFKLEYRDLVRAFAYIHATFGIVLSFVLADASYLFAFSGLMFMVNELVIAKKETFAAYHGEILATAFYLPIIMPVLVLATSALGLTMAYVYGLLFALGIFAVGTYIAPFCKYISIRTLFGKKNCSTVEGVAHILAVAFVMFFVVVFNKPNANVNLQGKQNNAKLPWDDALVYVIDEENKNTEYRIYDLNAYPYLKKYAEEMEYTGEYYMVHGECPEVEYSILSQAEENVLTITKVHEDVLVYLTFENIEAESFTIDDGITTKTYEFGDVTKYGMTIHNSCTVTINGGSVDVQYREVLRDYDVLIPEEYADEEEALHFNLWLLESYTLK